MSTDQEAAPASRLDAIRPADLARADRLQVIVKEETPFLPKVAFTLITVASLAGATFTGLGMGLTGAPLVLRWVTLWSLGLIGGFLVWRLVYLHQTERDLDQRTLDALNGTALARADRVVLVVAPIAALGATGALFASYLDGRLALRWSLVVGSLALATTLLVGVRRRRAAATGAVIVAGLIVGWGYADAGAGWQGGLRVLHLTAFSLWLGGALWNIGVAMPAGRANPRIDAVLAGARQLDRFRWVVRFSLPTIIITGLIMAGAYRALPLDWWLGWPGALIPFKVLLIIGLVVVFIMCPLFRQCSPVKGVCNIDDLYDGKPPADSPAR